MKFYKIDVKDIETDEDIVKNLETIRSYSIGAGLAINLETPIRNLIPYLPFIDEVIVMSIIPGSGGQKFHMEAIDKIKELSLTEKRIDDENRYVVYKNSCDTRCGKYEIIG